ncbi:MAG: LON peptidase substrate-binding domain-containing protein [Chloroflexota bacterium]|nr:LON peptidase substrate-binding domain-containing protein [Chloroflexota bacterium]
MRLPLFALHTVLFPHLPLPLQIFEERYRAMTRDLVADGSAWGGRFVVAAITDGSEIEPVGREAAQPTIAARIGTVAEVRHAEQFADGRWALLAVGVERVRFGPADRTGPYAVVEAEALPELVGDTDDDRLLPAVQVALDRYLETVKRLVASTASVGGDVQEISRVTASLDEILKPFRLPEDPLAASYAIGGMLQIELGRKQRLLELPDAATRLRAELDLLRRETVLLGEGSMPPLGANDVRYNRN